MNFLIKLCATTAILGLLLRQLCPFSLVQVAQTYCEKQIPNSIYRELYQAIVCGTPIRSSFFRQIFINTGLIHILVVSGSHLLFLENFFFLKKLRAQWKWGFILLPFAFFVGFQAPVTRALVLRTLYFPAIKKKIKLTDLQSQAFATLLCLLIFPGWMDSLSFLLSWTCAILLTAPPISQWPNEFENSIKIFIGLFPFAGSIGMNSPISILTNWLMAPLIGGILFPSALLSVFFPPLTLYIDGIWALLIEVLRPISFAPPTYVPLPSLAQSWIYPFILHLVLLKAEVTWKRIRLF